MTSLHNTLAYGVVAGLAAATIFLSARTSADLFARLFDKPPIVFHGAKMVNPIRPVPGDTLVFQSTRTKNEHCAAVYDQFILAETVRNDAPSVVFRDTVPGGYSRDKHTNVRFTIKLPVTVEPGRYCLAQIARLMCAGNRNFVVRPPEACFEVFPKR